MVYADEAAHSKEISQLWQQYYIKEMPTLIDGALFKSSISR